MVNSSFFGPSPHNTDCPWPSMVRWRSPPVGSIVGNKHTAVPTANFTFYTSNFTFNQGISPTCDFFLWEKQLKSVAAYQILVQSTINAPHLLRFQSRGAAAFSPAKKMVGILEIEILKLKYSQPHPSKYSFAPQNAQKVTESSLIRRL